jgi:hypothetical protein
MTTKCVNPACSAPFRYLRGGKLFLVDSPAMVQDVSRISSMSNMPHTSEFFWLCEKCCRSMRFALEKSGDVVLVGRSERQRITLRKSAQADRALVLVSGESNLS